MATGGLSIIQTMLSKLPQSEQKLAEYILQNPHEVVNSTVQELSTSAQYKRGCCDKVVQISRFERISRFENADCWGFDEVC